MPSRVGTGTSGSRGKAKYRSKHYHRKSNSTAPDHYARRQDIPSSNRRRNPPTRSSSQEKSLTHATLPPPPRYNQRKPWIGIFGTERGEYKHGSITILRREDASKPKGNVPSWLADTFGSLSKKHPLSEAVNDTTVMESVTLDPDHDDNPFAYQPPSPSQIPNTPQNIPFSYFAQREPARSPNVPSYHMGLSSIPFAPPTFVEPTYEDHYQDMIMPLNDFDYDYEPEGLVYSTNRSLDDRDSESVLPASRAASQLAIFQEMSSPTFSPRGYPSSPIATTPEFNTISSDDITLPTPIHHNILTPGTDEIQDALRANHPFVTSMYASSPSGSFRGFPVSTLVGSRESSPYGLVSSSRNMPAPEVTHRKVWTPRKELFPRTRAQSPPPSSDVYKSRLLAYATAIADHMSSSGDESLVGQETNEWVDPPEIKRATSSSITRSVSSLGPPNERAQTTLHESSEPVGGGNDYSTIPGLYTKALDPDNWIGPTLPKSLAVGRLDHTAAGIHSAVPEFGAAKSHRTENELDQTDLDDNFDLTDTHLEDWKNEPQSDGAMDDLEGDGLLLSDYEVMQAEYDTLAADEPSDDEDGPTEQDQVTTSQEDSKIEHSTLEVDNTASTMPQPSKPNPKIQPFPMKVTRPSLASDTIAPAESQPVLTRLSPKFVSQPSRRVRPSPFAMLLKKRFKAYSNAAGSNDQGAAAVEDKDDEIESWSG